MRLRTQSQPVSLQPLGGGATWRHGASAQRLLRQLPRAGLLGQRAQDTQVSPPDKTGYLFLKTL